MARRIRVLMVEDHPLYRLALVNAINRDPRLTVSASVGDGAQALRVIREVVPEVALVDLTLPGLSGLALLRALAEDAIPTRRVVLSADCEGATVQKALALGAAGYLSKDLDEEEICAAIVDVARGETVLSRQVQAVVAKQFRSCEVDPPPVITRREHDVLELAAKGASRHEIAASLHLSETTIKTHIASVYGKLGASNGASAVAEAMRRGLITTTN
ncbi:MAG: response regulator [Gaiellaceae bacterium]